MDIYLIRHTTPAIAKGVCYGHSDIDVAASFHEELTLLRSKLPMRPQMTVFSSPSQRCLKLALAIAGKRPIREDARLMELHFGDWEMQQWDDIPRGAVDVWAEDHIEQAPPQGESFRSLHVRAQRFLEEISEDHTIDGALVFTHAGVIRALLAEALQLPLVNAFRLQIDYASVSQIVVDGTATRVVCVNR